MVFCLLGGANVLLFLIGIGFLPTSSAFLNIALLPFGWLFVLAIKFRIEVAYGNGFVALPNTLGWLMILIGGIISVFIYRLIGHVVATIVLRNKAPSNTL